MRRLVILFMFCFALAAHGDPGITAFDNTGLLIWTNSQTSGYNRIEWSADLEDWKISWSNQQQFGGTFSRSITVDTPRVIRLFWADNSLPVDDVATIYTNDETYYSLSGNGTITFDNLDGGMDYAVDWSTDATNWYRDWHDFGSITVTGLTMSTYFPLHYRLAVLSTNIPDTDMAWIFGSEFAFRGGSSYVDGFYLDEYEVTHGLFCSVTNWASTNDYTFAAPMSADTDELPVAGVTWYEAAKWCNARSEMEGLELVYYLDASCTNAYRADPATNTFTLYIVTNQGYRLPSEIEWERAARGFIDDGYFPWGGTNDADITSAQANYRNSSDISELLRDLRTPVGGWSYDPHYSTNSTTPPLPDDDYLALDAYKVQEYPANDYGLKDMAGNMFEWCYDAYTRELGGPSAGTLRVIRGGCFGNNPDRLALDKRHFADPSVGRINIGFRCARGE